VALGADDQRRLADVAVAGVVVVWRRRFRVSLAKGSQVSGAVWDVRLLQQRRAVAISALPVCKGRVTRESRAAFPQI
jgi:hypothetical protein